MLLDYMPEESKSPAIKANNSLGTKHQQNMKMEDSEANFKIS